MKLEVLKIKKKVHKQMALSQYIFGQGMQTNLASSDCAAPTQCMAINSIHNVKNTTTITPLHQIPFRIPKSICEVEVFLFNF